jgi:hypothetical protein
MSISIIDRIGDVKIYGGGLSGGKGAGLVKINSCSIPSVHKLRTRILTTTFFDRYIELGSRFGREELKTLSVLLEKVGTIPISVRSSATNEAWVAPGERGSVHAGENTSFMLPNNHPAFQTRFNMLIQAVYFIYRDFLNKQQPESREKMAIVINPIPGISEQTYAGPIFYPLVSGVANSYFFHSLRSQNPDEGFARIAFGHGYATVLDEFPVVSMATIRKPLPVDLMGSSQKYFYAIDMANNSSLKGQELETMKMLNISFAGSQLIPELGRDQYGITFKNLIEKDAFGFRSQLCRIMDIISERISSHYQIEFVFNVNPAQAPSSCGAFHVVQLTELPKLTFEKIHIPENVKHTYLSVQNHQGHGVKRNITRAVVLSPFMYTKDRHDRIRAEISRINTAMKTSGNAYMIVVPGRLGSGNRNWGIQVDYSDLDGASAIFEYGVDIAGRPEPVSDEESLSGGIYGSHFLYMIQGGFDEEKKRVQTRMYGTQGTHFLTNLVSNNIIYGYISPEKDLLDPWFFTPQEGSSTPYVLEFPQPVAVFADSIRHRCLVIAENR